MLVIHNKGGVASMLVNHNKGGVASMLTSPVKEVCSYNNGGLASMCVSPSESIMLIGLYLKILDIYFIFCNLEKPLSAFSYI